MENGFEQYCLKRLEALEKENEELKAKNKYLEETSQANRSSFLYYDVEACTWHINKNNYAEYEKAATDGDYNSLDHNYFNVKSALADYEITLGNDTYYFSAETALDGKISLDPVILDKKDRFESYLAAKEYLFKAILNKVAEIKKELADKAKAQAE